MAIAVDATSTSSFPNGSNPIVFSHTVGAGSNRALLVGFMLNGTTSYPTINALTYGGVAMTPRISHQDSTNSAWVAWYDLLAPTTGTANVSITLSTGVASFGGCAISLTGVDQSTPLDASNTNVTNANPNLSESITTVTSGALVVDLFTQSSGAVTSNTVGGGQTQFLNILTGGSFLAVGASYKLAGAAGAQTMSWTANANGWWSTALYAVRPAGAGGASGASKLMMLGVG